VNSYWGVPKIYDPNTFKAIEPQNLHKYNFVSWDGKYGISLSYGSHYELVDLGSNDVIAKIPNLHPTLSYTNFIAFHPSKNNEFVVAGIAPPETGSGFIKSMGFTKVSLYGSTKPTIRVYHNDSYPMNKAVWKCGFSNNGQYLAAYDSNPITYIMSLTRNRKFDEINRINGKNFVCWVPDSKAIVVSDNSYRARTTGGSGWSKSRSLWIVSIYDGSELKNYDDHNSEVVFANFSEDGKKMISRSEDGVVIIRAV
jgi:WD40 repeat protein